MRYADVLEECLAALRRGEDTTPLLAANPAFAEQLRLDIAAAGVARRLSAELPEPTPAARQLFRSNLNAQRAAVAARRPRFGWFGLKSPVLALAGGAVVALVVALAVGGVLIPADTAEASIEGVLVENDGNLLTLQTEDGLQSVALDESGTVSSETGAPVDLASLEPGQLLRVQAKRKGPGALLARRIELRASGELTVWCERFSDPCLQLEKTISERASECVRDAPICQSIRTRLQILRTQNAARMRLSDLQSRCESGVEGACREVQQLCQSNKPACASISDWLRSRRLR